MTPATAKSAPELDAHRVAVARLWAVERQPYLAAALFASPVVAAPGLGGAAVDEEWRLYLDPERVAQWEVETLGSLLIHHAGHLLRDHAGRARRAGVAEATGPTWAVAADAEINDDLIGTGLRLPDDPVLPQAMGWRPGRLAEEYFHGAVGADGEHAHTPECGSGADGLHRPWELVGDQPGGLPKALPSGERHLLRCQVAREVIAYARQGRGKVPGKFRRWAEDLVEPKVDWRRLLAGELRRSVATVAGCADFTYRWPSRRSNACPGVILPAMARPIPEVAVICDTSGSMVEQQLAQVLAEVEGLLRGIGLARNRVRVLAVDAAVQAARRVSTARQVELVGGGGTDMGAGIGAAARLRPRPSVLVVLTDGLTPWPAQAPKGIEVVVGLIGDQGGQGRWTVPAWAKVVRIPVGPIPAWRR
ncbi:MAG: VWA-like domain-containing protein [Actinomycetota bacterium]|nr:VWA-like domain-containing protein [Actinomycetota bacterium]